MVRDKCAQGMYRSASVQKLATIEVSLGGFQWAMRWQIQNSGEREQRCRIMKWITPDEREHGRSMF
jgi:hypothetical protein